MTLMSRALFAAFIGFAFLTNGSAFAQSDESAIFVSNNGNLEGSVTAFRVNANGSLSFANKIVTGTRANISDPCAGCNAYEISLTPDGRHLVSAHAAGDLDGLSFFRVNADTTITLVAQLSLPVGTGTPLDAAWLNNEYVAVTRTDTNPDRIVVYRFDPSVPAITEQLPNTLTAGNSLGFLAVHPSGLYLYANDSTLKTISAYTVSPTGVLALIDTEPTGAPFPLELAVSPDGTKLYAAGGISDGGNKVLGFAIAGDGTLSLLPGAPYLSQGSSPSNVFVNDTNTHVVVGHGTDATCRTMSIDAGTGALTATGFSFDVGLQGTLGDVRVAGGNVFVTDNSTATDGLMGVYSFTLGANGSLISNGPILSSQGIAPRSIASWLVEAPKPLCPADIAPPGGDEVVNVQDLLAVIGAWGPCGDPNPPNCPADIAPIGPPVGDDVVNVQDLLEVIGAWGACD